MKAVVCHESTLFVRDVPDPSPAKGQLLVKVLRCGICGSDLHARRHADQLHEAAAATGYEDAMKPADEVVLGHEYLGEVLEAGRGFRAGDRVVALPMLRAGGAVQMVGLSRHAQGGYAEAMLTEASMTLKVPSDLSDDAAVLTEPMAVALHAVRRSEVGRRQAAVVVGCGPIGLAVIAMLKARGVRTVVASDYSAVRRVKAAECGADVVVDPAAEDLWSAYDTKRYFTSATDLLEYAVRSMEGLRRLPGLPWAAVMKGAELAGADPQGPVVFECVGVPGMIDDVITHAPLQSRVVVVGVCMAPDTIRPATAINKEVDLRFVFAYTPRDFHDALGMLAGGKLPVEPFVTGHVGLEGVEGAFDTLADPGEHAKILIDPSLSGTEVRS